MALISNKFRQAFPWCMLRKRHTSAAAAFLGIVASVSVSASMLAQSTPINLEQSKITVAVYKSGLFSSFAHDHQIAAPLASGTLDRTAKVVELRFDARKMKVLDPGVSASDRAQVQETMLSDKVLDAARFPDIVFASRRVSESAPGSYTVEGELTLHGVLRKVIVPVTWKSDRYIGSVKLNQSDFAIKPVRLFGGTVKVKDVIQVEFEIVPLREQSAQR